MRASVEGGSPVTLNFTKCESRQNHLRDSLKVALQEADSLIFSPIDDNLSEYGYFIVNACTDESAFVNHSTLTSVLK